MPKFNTERLWLKSPIAEDAVQRQKLYPRWKVVRYMAASVPWPFPDHSAESYVNNVSLPDMAKRIAWLWTIRCRKTPDDLMGIDKDYIHYLIQTVPTYSVKKIVNIIKRLTARDIFKRC